MAASHPCLKCNQQVKQKCKAIQCSFCEYWVHIECGDISEALYKEMCKRADTHGHFWVCMSCKSTSFVFRRELDKLNQRMVNAEERIQTTSDNLDIAKEDINTVKGRVSNLEEQRDQDVAKTKDSVFEELSDRENRKTNLVFHNIPESTSLEADDRKEADSESVLDITKTIKLKLNQEKDIKFMTRLGTARDRPSTAAPRPLLVGWNKEAVKYSILKNARLLKGSKHEKISIVPDLTQRQRDDEDKLRKEAERLNANLSEEDSLNWEWKLVGPRGCRKLQKGRIRRHQHRQDGEQVQRTEGHQTRTNRGGRKRGGEDLEEGQDTEMMSARKKPNSA